MSTSTKRGALGLAVPFKAGLWPWPELLFWSCAIAAYFLFQERLPLITEIFVLGLFALSLDLILGYAGIVSLGHAAFFGVGAYTAGILAQSGWGEPVSGLLIAAATAMAVGFASSFLVLRGRDLTRLMVTLGVAMLIYEAANQAAWLTGGADGLVGMTVWPVLGVFEFDLYGHTAYWYSFAVLFLLFCLARRLVNSPFGLSLRGIKENRLRMAAIGTPVNRRLVLIYTVAAGYAGAAGALLAQTTQFVSLDVLAFHRSAEALLMLVIGGSGMLYGALVGALSFKVLQDLFSNWTAQYWQFWLGLLLVLLVLFARGGIMGAAQALRRRHARGRRASAPQERRS